MSRFLDTPRSIAVKLAARVEDVCRELLPAGKRDGHEWRCGSTDGDTGKSLGVHLSGNKAGVWADFASGEGGDLLDLWVATRRCAMGQAMGEARAFLGLSVPTFERSPKAFKRPAKPKCSVPKSAVREYLAARGLSDGAIKAYHVGERGNVIVFPFIRDGELLLAKEREAVDGEKPKPTAADCEKTAFGWQAIPADAREVVITEGEIDAMSSWEMAAPALSVPFGGGGGNKQDWVENDFDHLARFDVIYLAVDADGPGEECAIELAKRLGPERCRRVQFPAGMKDANDLLKAGWTGEDWLALLRGAKSLDPAELRRASDYTAEIINQFYPAEAGGEVAFHTPWPKLTEELRFRPGELCILQGINGHGKALALDTPIPSPNGWTNMGNLAAGDVIYSETGVPCRVTFATEVMHRRPCYLVKFSDGSEIIADEEHRWLTKTQLCLRSERNNQKNIRLRAGKPVKRDQSHLRTYPKVVTTGEIRDSLQCNGISNHAIAVAAPVVGEHLDLQLDPYCLGAWLGDGSSSAAGITSADAEVLEQFANAGFELTKRTHGQYEWGLLGGFWAKLKLLSVVKNKHVPDDYMRASATQRLALLQGLMDTDGHITDYGRCEFCNTNFGLAESVLELANSLGIIAKIIHGRAKLNGRDCGPKYRVTFTTAMPVFRLSRKLVKLQKRASTRSTHRWIVSCDPIPSVPVRCIQVDSPSHLFLAGRSFIPTHNTELAGNLVAHVISMGGRACIASMEFKPRKWLARLCRQVSGVEKPSERYIRDIAEWWHPFLWAFDVTGKAKSDRILSVFEYAARRHQVAFFVIDNLAKCGFDEDDYNGQKDFVDKLTDLARELDVFLILVCHPKKVEDESKAPGKMDVKGSGAITDMADTVLSIWRNKAKHEKIERLESQRMPVPDDIANLPDAVLACHKQRNGESEPKIALWFDRASHQFLQSPKHDARRYVIPNVSTIYKDREAA